MNKVEDVAKLTQQVSTTLNLLKANATEAHDTTNGIIYILVVMLSLTKL